MFKNFYKKILVNSSAGGIQMKRHTHHGNVSTGFISERISTSTINSKQRTYVSCINFIYILEKEKFTISVTLKAILQAFKKIYKYCV